MCSLGNFWVISLITRIVGSWGSKRAVQNLGEAAAVPAALPGASLLGAAGGCPGATLCPGSHARCPGGRAQCPAGCAQCPGGPVTPLPRWPCPVSRWPCPVPRWPYPVPRCPCDPVPRWPCPLPGLLLSLMETAKQRSISDRSALPVTSSSLWLCDIPHPQPELIRRPRAPH